MPDRIQPKRQILPEGPPKHLRHVEKPLPSLEQQIPRFPSPGLNAHLPRREEAVRHEVDHALHQLRKLVDGRPLRAARENVERQEARHLPLPRGDHLPQPSKLLEQRLEPLVPLVARVVHARGVIARGHPSSEQSR